MSRYREQDDGSRLFPVRGNPPPETVGFVRDPGNPFILRPVMRECRLRVIQTGQSCQVCNKTYQYWACEGGQKASFRNCNACIDSGQQATLLARHPDKNSGHGP